TVSHGRPLLCVAGGGHFSYIADRALPFQPRSRDRSTNRCGLQGTMRGRRVDSKVDMGMSRTQPRARCAGPLRESATGRMAFHYEFLRGESNATVDFEDFFVRGFRGFRGFTADVFSDQTSLTQAGIS